MISEPKRVRDENAEDIFANFKQSFHFDRRLFFAAVRINLVYCDALFNAGIVTRIEAERIRSGLQTLLKRAEFNKNYFEEFKANDVHSFIETRLVQLIGEAGEKITVGRSQYDRNVTAFRWWLREEIEEISERTRSLQSSLIKAGERQKEAIFPAYAGQRKTQPILWAHWCLAYFEMFARDCERLDEVWRRVNVLPLGAADLAGTAIEIDREEIARALHFEGVSANSLDTVSDADFAIESVNAGSLIMNHLSRLAEDLILYGADEFGLIEFSADSKSPNASAVSNVEVLEIVRARAGEVFGHQIAVVSMTKNLPLGFHNDFRQIMQTAFELIETVKICLKIAATVLNSVRVRESETLKIVSNNYLNCSELIDYLAHRNVPPKAAKKTADEIIRYARSKETRLENLSLEEFRKFSEEINADVFDALSLENALASKNQIGGTAPERVFEALEQARETLEREKENADLRFGD